MGPISFAVAARLAARRHRRRSTPGRRDPRVLDVRTSDRQNDLADRAEPAGPVDDRVGRMAAALPAGAGSDVMGSGAKSWWALVLAGGDGVRLRALTRRIAGDERPKQFCDILGQATVLEQTITRAEMVIPSDQILVAVVRAHERFYTPLLADISPRCMVIQPENRGSAPAILYALLRLLTMAPEGPVAIFPSDHYVSDDRVFMAHVEGALDMVVSRPELAIVLGIAPDTDEVEYGWIEAGEMIGGASAWPLFKVRSFWEKPLRAFADTLRAGGCFWNSFVIAAYPSLLISLIRRAIPTTLRRLRHCRVASEHALGGREHSAALFSTATSGLLEGRADTARGGPRGPSRQRRDLERSGGASTGHGDAGAHGDVPGVGGSVHVRAFLHHGQAGASAWRGPEDSHAKG